MTARRSRTSVLITASLLVAFVGWSVLLFSWPAMLALDDRLVAPPLDPMSNSAQIAAAFALLAWPGLQYLALVGLAGGYIAVLSTKLWIAEMTGGRGWIAVALVIFARWSPWRSWPGGTSCRRSSSRWRTSSRSG